MIVFDLQCNCGWQFEGWFISRSNFEQQNRDGLITCPHCGCNEIHKILSPVAIHSHKPKQRVPVLESDAPGITPEQVINFLRSLQDYVEKNSEDVGHKLATESLKIHYGVVEPRNIRGVATADEEKMLIDEGIELLKIPMIKKSSGSKLN